MNILDQLVAATKIRLEKDRAALPLPRLLEQGFPAREPFAFQKALAGPGMNFICEVKKASPSKGVIAAEFPYLQIAKEYEAAGACAISVLTEPDYFMGRDSYLREISGAVGIPVLRKDFITDPYQVYQAKALGADALLLICAILTPGELKALHALARELGLSALVEAHDEQEVEMALTAGASIIGVNNRDLKTFRVDTGTSVRLRKLVPKEVLFVSESGITGAREVKTLADAGVNAVLVGETLMRSGDKKAALAALRGEGTL